MTTTRFRSEVRVLGCLIEKQRTTPDVYPLSLNALRTACNQSTSREPVVSYDDDTIRDALHRLGRRRWTRRARGEVPPPARREPRAGPGRAGRARGADAARAADGRRAALAHRADAAV